MVIVILVVTVIVTVIIIIIIILLMNGKCESVFLLCLSVLTLIIVRDLRNLLIKKKDQLLIKGKYGFPLHAFQLFYKVLEGNTLANLK